jgi:GNAT superfamily N-acetyltransferase
MTGIEFQMAPPLTEAQLAKLLEEEWGEGAAQGYGRALERSLTYVAAFQDGTLVGFVNLAWDGNLHAFIVDAIVRETMRGRGIGLELVRRAIAAAREAGVRWVHADYEPHLDSFWAKAGFVPTRARVLHLGSR